MSASTTISPRPSGCQGLRSTTAVTEIVDDLSDGPSVQVLPASHVDRDVLSLLTEPDAVWVSLAGETLPPRLGERRTGREVQGSVGLARGISVQWPDQATYTVRALARSRADASLFVSPGPVQLIPCGEDPLTWDVHSAALLHVRQRHACDVALYATRPLARPLERRLASDVLRLELARHPMVEHIGRARIPVEGRSWSATALADRRGFEHLVLALGQPGDGPQLVVHECVVAHALGASACGCGEALRTARQEVERARSGQVALVRAGITELAVSCGRPPVGRVAELWYDTLGRELLRAGVEAAGR